MYQLVCHDCHKKHPADTPAFRCDCGGLFDIDDDRQVLDLEYPDAGEGLWRFARRCRFGARRTRI